MCFHFISLSFFSPCRKPQVVVHTTPGNALDEVYAPLLGYSTFDGASLQISNKLDVFSQTLKWVQASSAAGRKWVVANDEQGSYQTGVVPDTDDPTHDVVRKNVLWGNIMAGGAGVEYYFGYSYSNSDLTCNDFRSRNTMWEQSRLALEFFQVNNVPFWEMSNRNDTVSVDWCLEKPGEVYVVYIKNAVTATIDLAVSGSYTVKWYNPITGGGLQDGSIRFITGGTIHVSLGNAPNSTIHDWAILIQKEPTQPASPTPLPVVPPTPLPVAPPTPLPVAPPTPLPVAPRTPLPVVPPTPRPVAPPTPLPVILPTQNPTATGPRITGLVLINATNDQAIGPLVNGGFIDGAAKNIRADVAGSVKSVVFGFDTNGRHRTDSVAPYAFSGETKGNYLPFTFTPGQHTVTAKPYSRTGGTGTKGTATSVTFTVT
jgi:hypothetical protein